MRSFAPTLIFCLLPVVLSQRIFDVWQTTYDKSKLFKRISTRPIDFNAGTTSKDAVIYIDDDIVHQPIEGLGATLTDSSAYALCNLKKRNPSKYNQLLNELFDISDGAASAGFTMLRVPLGASDFSHQLYSYDDVANDFALRKFNINRTPSYVFDTLKDIINVNPRLKLLVLPWSPPGWMKDTGSMNGGTLYKNYTSLYATYLLKSLQGFRSKGLTPWAISIQNEPEYGNPSYPTAVLPVSLEAKVGSVLRTLMDQFGFRNTKIIGYEHNWNDAAKYPVQLIKACDSFEGVAFHCYSGDVSQQADFAAKYPQKSIYFTECASTHGNDWWSDLKWNVDNVAIGALRYGSRTAMMWTLAGEPGGGPKLEGSSSCGGSGCRPVVTIKPNDDLSFSPEFYSMAQVAKATIPKDDNGPFAKRIGLHTEGLLKQHLTIGTYVTERASESDWLRYSMVVMNKHSASIKTTISFRGQKATYVYPPGVTTLWWFAPEKSARTHAANFQKHKRWLRSYQRVSV